jgi:hypothetical protein
LAIADSECAADRGPSLIARIAESGRVASRLMRRGVSAGSADSGRRQPHPAFGRSGLRRARRASGGAGGQVCGWWNPLGSARWDPISMWSPHHLRPARAGRRLRLTGKHTTGWGRMRPAKFGCRWGGGTSLSRRQTYQAGFDANDEPRTGAADLRAQRPRGQGQCAIANAATNGIPHDDGTRAGARNGGND